MNRFGGISATRRSSFTTAPIRNSPGNPWSDSGYGSALSRGGQQKRALAEAHRALRASKSSLLKRIGELELLSSVDGPTGLSNRRYSDEFAAMQWKLAIRERLRASRAVFA